MAAISNKEVPSSGFLKPLWLHNQGQVPFGLTTGSPRHELCQGQSRYMGPNRSSDDASKYATGLRSQ